MSENNLIVAVVALCVLLLGIAGTDDYEHAKLQEKTLCERGATKPEWCREVNK